MKNNSNWTKFALFPSPADGGYLNAPIGAGVYELINKKTDELIYVGESKTVSCRMSSLLPKGFGAGTRKNSPLRQYILENLELIYYRTLDCKDKKTAKKIQNEMIKKNKYRFN